MQCVVTPAAENAPPIRRRDVTNKGVVEYNEFLAATLATQREAYRVVAAAWGRCSSGPLERSSVGAL